MRGTVITALKYTISDHPQPIDAHLHKYIARFLAAISDPDLVRAVGEEGKGSGRGSERWCFGRIVGGVKGLDFICIKTAPWDQAP